MSKVGEALAVIIIIRCLERRLALQPTRPAARGLHVFEQRVLRRETGDRERPGNGGALHAKSPELRRRPPLRQTGSGRLLQLTANLLALRGRNPAGPERV